MHVSSESRPIETLSFSTIQLDCCRSCVVVVGENGQLEQEKGRYDGVLDVRQGAVVVRDDADTDHLSEWVSVSADPSLHPISLDSETSHAGPTCRAC